MNAVDTNILIYVHDPRDPRKQAIAAELVRSLADGVLLWQVACEYLAASRKLTQFGFQFDQALANVHDLRSIWTTVLPGWNVLLRVGEWTGGSSFAFWDGMLVAACLEAGVDRLYSEDFGDLRQFEGLEIVNPFRDV